MRVEETCALRISPTFLIRVSAAALQYPGNAQVPDYTYKIHTIQRRIFTDECLCLCSLTFHLFSSILLYFFLHILMLLLLQVRKCARGLFLLLVFVLLHFFLEYLHPYILRNILLCTNIPLEIRIISPCCCYCYYCLGFERRSIIHS